MGKLSLWLKGLRLGLAGLIMVLVLCTPASADPLTGTSGNAPALYRINVGGEAVTASDGAVWSPDSFTQPSPLRTGSGGDKITSTESPIDLSHASLPASAQIEQLFQSERWDPQRGSPMRWTFPVEAGRYQVRLFLAETYPPIDAPQKRLFDVAVEDVVPAEFDDLDVFAGSGGLNRGLMVSCQTTVTDDALNLEFRHGIQNPALKGIEILALEAPSEQENGTEEENPGEDEEEIAPGSAAQQEGISQPEDSQLDTNSASVEAPQTAPFAPIAAVDPVVSDAIGAAQITITPRGKIQISNFGTNKFTVENVGEKRIAALYFDVSQALFPDIVFDPVGVAGDSVARGLAFSITGGSGVIEPGFERDDEDVLTPFYGVGGVDGYKGMLITFDPEVDGGYQPGERIRFGVDMDPNSIVGIPQVPRDINGDDPRLARWDIGGVSGAEMINAQVYVLFTDGTTALGELFSDGSQGGAIAISSQASQQPPPEISVNGLEPGNSGPYLPADTQISISGPAGSRARIVMVKGFIQPFDYTAPSGQVIAPSASFVDATFPANHAIEVQAVDITLTGSNQEVTDLFDLGPPGGELAFAGDERLPIAVVAATVDERNRPTGPVSDPIYLVPAD